MEKCILSFDPWSCRSNEIDFDNICTSLGVKLKLNDIKNDGSEGKIAQGNINDDNVIKAIHTGQLPVLSGVCTRVSKDVGRGSYKHVHFLTGDYSNLVSIFVFMADGNDFIDVDNDPVRHRKIFSSKRKILKEVDYVDRIYRTSRLTPKVYVVNFYKEYELLGTEDNDYRGIFTKYKEGSSSSARKKCYLVENGIANIIMERVDDSYIEAFEYFSNAKRTSRDYINRRNYKAMSILYTYVSDVLLGDSSKISDYEISEDKSTRTLFNSIRKVIEMYRKNRNEDNDKLSLHSTNRGMSNDDLLLVKYVKDIMENIDTILNIWWKNVESSNTIYSFYTRFFKSLFELHLNDILHHDLKTDNMFLIKDEEKNNVVSDSDTRMKPLFLFIDFGLATLVENHVKMIDKIKEYINNNTDKFKNYERHYINLFKFSFEISDKIKMYIREVNGLEGNTEDFSFMMKKSEILKKYLIYFMCMEMELYDLFEDENEIIDEKPLKSIKNVFLFDNDVLIDHLFGLYRSDVNPNEIYNSNSVLDLYTFMRGVYSFCTTITINQIENDSFNNMFSDQTNDEMITTIISFKTGIYDKIRKFIGDKYKQYIDSQIDL